MTVERMCELGQVSRPGFYRYDPDREPEDRDLELRDAIQRIALEFPYYGRPRVVPELRRRGWQVGHRRVARILREDNLLTVPAEAQVHGRDHRFESSLPRVPESCA